MFSIDEAYSKSSYYFPQIDLYSKAISFACGVFFVINYLRQQTSEIEVLQLVPGLYLFLLLICLLFLLFSNFLWEKIPLRVDIRKLAGTKTKNRLDIGVFAKSAVLFATVQLLININTVIPIALDSFNSYGERTLENIWSLDEIVGLEFYFLFIIGLLAQIPVLADLSFHSQEFILRLPTVWRIIGVTCFTLGGVATPTIDSTTQVSFAASTYSLYLGLIVVRNRELNIKYKEIFTLS